MKLVNAETVNYVWPITSTFSILLVTDPELAHFVMNLRRVSIFSALIFSYIFVISSKMPERFKIFISPEVQRKAGLSKEFFSGDPNGFLHGLVFDEGKSWQINRKRLGKQLHLGILESYIGVSPRSIRCSAFEILR